MLYIHQSYSIAAQQSVLNDDINTLSDVVDKKLFATEPAYEGIPPGILRRMGKAIRMGVGAALPICKERAALDGIIIGSANGAMEDCIKFLNQIVQYEEGLLTPGNFVQSTSNAIAGQLGLITANKGYNITHVHLGLAFENALLDVTMQLNENPDNSYLLGGVDEISSFNYNIEDLAGTYKKESISLKQLYETDSPGCVAGEGATMFVVNKNEANAIAKVEAVYTLHSKDVEEVSNKLKKFLSDHLDEVKNIDLFLSGENGDNRTLKFYSGCEALLNEDTPIARFKHLCGEYPTAAAFGLWLSCQLLQTQEIPTHMLKNKPVKRPFRKILMYNNFKGNQHSFMLVSIV